MHRAWRQLIDGALFIAIAVAFPRPAWSEPTKAGVPTKAEPPRKTTKPAACPAGMVHVPAATFLMGSPDGSGDGPEHPQHSVTLSKYCIDKTEVTVGAYLRCVAAKQCAALEPQRFDDACHGWRVDRKDHPVNCVTQLEAKTYCAFAGKRLPTEAEWEYAALGGTERNFPWGNEPPSVKLLNMCDRECAPLHTGNMNHAIYDDSDGWATTAPVGSFPSGASPFGALDMAGNVAEWTADADGRYTADASVNPTGPAESGLNGTSPAGKGAPTAGWRVIRGGDWGSNHASYVRGRGRTATLMTSRMSSLGFRCVRPQ